VDVSAWSKLRFLQKESSEIQQTTGGIHNRKFGRVVTGRRRDSAGLEPPWPLKARLLLWCGIAVLTATGCLGIYGEVFSLWKTWTSDPLRSIGMLIPPASILLTLRVWRMAGTAAGTSSGGTEPPP
jgi:hypothetical protein